MTVLDDLKLEYQNLQSDLLVAETKLINFEQLLEDVGFIYYALKRGEVEIEPVYRDMNGVPEITNQHHINIFNDRTAIFSSYINELGYSKDEFIEGLIRARGEGFTNSFDKFNKQSAELLVQYKKDYGSKKSLVDVKRQEISEHLLSEAGL